MMKSLCISFFFAQIALVSCATKNSNSDVASKKDLELEQVWEVKEGLENPESALFDKNTNAIYVSNIAGNATEKDGNGWISKISDTGQVLQAKWFQGLNAPKGLAVSDNTLWVADIDTIVGISLSTAKILHKFTISEAKFLNDATSDGKGSIFVSDMFGNKIYKIAYDAKGFQNPSVYLEGELALKGPNGLVFDGDKLIVAQWGTGIKDDFSTATLGGIVAFKNNKKEGEEVVASLGNLDGLESFKDGFLYSDYMKGEVGFVN